MKRLFSAKSLLVAAVALGAAGVASAHTDVVLSLGVSAPIGYVQPYVQSQPVYVEAQPAYVQPEVVYYGHDWRRREELRRAEFRHHGWERSAWADADHDGVPNRYDRAPYNPYRR
jgi:hypothetical protein